MNQLNRENNKSVNNYCGMVSTEFNSGYFIFNGKKEGENKNYYDNGQLYIIYNFINNKLEGEYKQYYSDSKLWQTCNYKNGKAEGEFKSYYENGLPERICNYKNGNREGECKDYYCDGELQSIRIIKPSSSEHTSAFKIALSIVKSVLFWAITKIMHFMVIMQMQTKNFSYKN